MKPIITFITEAIATKKELTEFENAWLNWLIKNGKEGNLPNASKNIKQELINKAKKYYDYEIEHFENNIDHYFINDICKFIKKNNSYTNIDNEFISSKNKLYKYVKKMFDDAERDDDEFFDVINKIFKKDNIKDFQKWYDSYLMDRFFSEFDKFVKLDNKTGLLKIVRSIGIPKKTFNVKFGWDKKKISYQDWINDYFEGLGIYWSFNEGGVYCFQSFDDDKMVDAGNMVTLDIYGLVDLKSIDTGTTFKQLSGNFGTEQEITIISGADIEVYKVIIKDGNNKSKLPLKKSIICKA